MIFTCSQDGVNRNLDIEILVFLGKMYRLEIKNLVSCTMNCALDRVCDL